MDPKSLFARLGSSTGIAALVDDIVGLHMENPIISARFRPYLGTEKLDVIKKHLCAFLETGSGGTLKYTGRDMRAAHTGMNISGTEYMAALDDIMAALRKHGIDEQTQKDMLFIGYSLKNEIVRI